MHVVPDSPQHGAEPVERPWRILVVDDDPGIRALCSAVLGAEGHEIVEAADGREGLARATSDEPDLALLDVNMPLLDGYELAAALRQGERTRHLPFVFVTGEPEPEVVAHADSVGALGFVPKPFEPSALAELVRRLLEQNDPPRPGR